MVRSSVKFCSCIILFTGRGVHPLVGASTGWGEVASTGYGVHLGCNHMGCILDASPRIEALSRRQTVNRRAVCILLKCMLVLFVSTLVDFRMSNNVQINASKLSNKSFCITNCWTAVAMIYALSAGISLVCYTDSLHIFNSDSSSFFSKHKMLHSLIKKHSNIYRPRSEASECYVFTGICLFNSGGGGLPSWGGGLPKYIFRQTPPRKADPLPRQTPPPPCQGRSPLANVDPLPTQTPYANADPPCQGIRSMGGRFASYWNAYL